MLGEVVSQDVSFVPLVIRSAIAAVAALVTIGVVNAVFRKDEHTTDWEALKFEGLFLMAVGVVGLAVVLILAAASSSGAAES